MNSTQLENKKILNLNENIFRAYDIRGIAYTDLSKDVVINIGRAIARKVKKNNQNQLIIGRDGRNSSPDMASFLKSGISQEGCNIIDLGIVPTPALYFATYKLESNCAIMITGSHNPSNYNGFKIVINNKALSAEEIQEIKYSILDEYRTPVKLQNIEENQIQILDQYLKSIVNNIHLKKPLNIVIDCGNGAASVIAKEVFEKLGCNVKPLFCELDGNFPNHHPDPSKEENMKDL
ncbi:MAG: phosphomannomutase/phosphoglucomutase, partial [Pelagibacterales bacterium]|nr:phosphomannomutase/phosphoglucomutase [Pelagibacterales bacterium]